VIKWIKSLIELRGFYQDSRWFEKNPAAQVRFEENEDWSEELEDRIIELEEILHEPSPRSIEKRIKKLEAMAHPKCGIEGFDGYHPLVERLSKLEEMIVVKLKDKDDR